MQAFLKGSKPTSAKSRPTDGVISESRKPPAPWVEK